MKQVRLNRLELWIADHAAPIFIIVAALIVAGAIGITVVFLQAREAGDQVNVLKPQVTRVNKAICDKQSLNHAQRAERCAERIRIGLINCRRSEPCRAAFLAVATSPPPPARGGRDSSSPLSSTMAESTSPARGDSGGGDAHQPPSNHGHQQPGPGSQPGQPEAAPAPPPSPGAESPSGPETPANGPQDAPGGGSASGADVEVCAVKTCVGAEVNVPGL